MYILLPVKVWPIAGTNCELQAHPELLELIRTEAMTRLRVTAYCTNCDHEPYLDYYYYGTNF